MLAYDLAHNKKLKVSNPPKLMNINFIGGI